MLVREMCPDKSSEEIKKIQQNQMIGETCGH
jgi:hypothetical protein